MTENTQREQEPDVESTPEPPISVLQILKENWVLARSLIFFLLMLSVPLLIAWKYPILRRFDQPVAAELCRTYNDWAHGTFARPTDNRVRTMALVSLVDTDEAVREARRAVTDLGALGERTLRIDCDVLQADGGTRTASITGAYVALHDAVDWLRQRGRLAGEPLIGSVAAVSVGVVGGTPMLDLCYREDSGADTDMNVVMSGTGEFIEVQGTAEGVPFDRAVLDQLLDLGAAGCAELTRLQQAALAS